MLMEEQKISGNHEELVHYGVLGMKWGIIRTPQQLGHKKPKSANGSGKKDDRSKRKMQRNIKSDKKKIERDKQAKVQKMIGKLSDDELKARVNRLNLEKQYMDLITPKAPAVSKGKEIAYSILSSFGKAAAVSFGKNFGSRLGQKEKGKDQKQKEKTYSDKEDEKNDKLYKQMKDRSNRYDWYVKQQKKAMRRLGN